MDYSMLVGVHDPSKVGALEPPVKQELRQKRGPLPDIQYESLTDVENSPKLVSRRSLSFHGLEESKDETNTNVSEALSTVVVDDEDDSTDEDILPTPDALYVSATNSHALYLTQYGVGHRGSWNLKSCHLGKMSISVHRTEE